MRYALYVLVLSASARCFSGEEKVPVPEKPAITEAEKTIREMLKVDYAKPAPTDRAALAEKLLSQGIEEQKDMASKYVLLRDARDLAAAVGNAVIAIKAVTEMAKAFALDAFVEKNAALAKAEVAVRTPDAAEPLARQYAELADEAIAADKYEVALKALGKASTAATTAKNVPLVNDFKTKAAKVQAMQREYAAVSSALKTVAEKPDDPAANFTVGKFLCFTKEAWDIGLPYLAKGSDAALKAIAEKDLARPTNPEEQAALADAWQATGDKQQGPVKSGCMARACYWNEQAGPKLTGIARTKAIAQVDGYDKAVGRVRMNPILTPDEQVKPIVEQLKAANPGYDGKVDYKTEHGSIVELSFKGEKAIQNIGPLKGVPVRSLNLWGTKVFDLSPLVGAPLTSLNLQDTLVRDLSPLKGMLLREINLSQTKIPDHSLAVLRSMPLEKVLLHCTFTSEAAVAPLIKPTLKELGIFACCNLKDLSFLRGASLKKLSFIVDDISKGWDVLRNVTSLEVMEPQDGQVMTAKEFWRAFDAGAFKGSGGKPDKKTK